ncbi:MAG: CPBP family intramembrane glutamic endopeptidase [Gemmataceae bacterium]|nr:CPBP family intramembrane metalloprotease [Gemmata sp.]MDW8198928.1 CPBP family intramembrane glutamic endopeptidase [Gemmataceae bacterium]
MVLWIGRYWEKWIGEPLRKVEADALAYRLSDSGRRIDGKTPWVLTTAAICLLVQNYSAHPTDAAVVVSFTLRPLLGAEVANHLDAVLRRWGADPLAMLLWWGIHAALCYSVLPILVLKLVLRERLADHGLKLHGVLKAWPLYVMFAVVMVPLVGIFSGTEHFQRTYPFFRVVAVEQVRADLWKWELAYAVQFVGLEFFFRGFLVHGTKHRFGVYAVFVAMVPYVQIHFGKPLAEAVASIVAGIVLGFMSLITRSVWLGAALHIGVAWGMDGACLYRRGLL